MLENLFTAFGTDKGTWGYTPYYERHLNSMRNDATNILEIGICGYRDIPNNVVGASLFAWRDYFPHAVINGLDNDGRFIFNDQDRIRTQLADAYNGPQLMEALRVWGNPKYDFICDDAVHDPVPQVHLLWMLWPFLKTGGVYAIEEACSYKLPGNDINVLANMALNAAPNAEVDIYKSTRDEHLLILTKRD